MKAVGIIAEYNPFHNGHRFHITKTIETCGATHVIAVMSGNYVQRGEPALVNKWVRAKMALLNGVDLVLELPLPWATCSAEKFAAGGVSILDQIGCTDFLSFGSETGDLQSLTKATDALSSPDYALSLKLYLDKGYSFPRAREAAVRATLGNEAALSLMTPNDTLGVEYLKALKGKTIKPIVIKRTGVSHDAIDAENDFASASMIRTAFLSESIPLKNNQYLPISANACLEDAMRDGLAPAILPDISVLTKLRSMTLEELQTLPDSTEGIHNRLYNAIQKATGTKELYNLIKTKRYTHSRIRRLVLAAFLGIQNELVQGLPPYIRVLGFNNKGAEILKHAKKTAHLPIILRTTAIDRLDAYSKSVFALESKATDLYALMTPTFLPCGAEYINSPIKTSDI